MAGLSDVEIWEGIEARLRSVEWSKPKSTVRTASYNSGREPDAWAALNRNATAAECDQPVPSRVRGMHRPKLALPYISEEVKADYDYTFAEREGLKIDAGMAPRCGSKEVSPNCCALHSTLLEVGCLEFYDYASALPYVRGMVRASARPLAPVSCARCESVGHLVEACPFGLADSDVMNIARLRRERRASSNGQRRKVV
jgi:hypothetical protein